MRFWGQSAKNETSDVLERLERVERRLKDIELEWENFFDKARRMLQRISKRAERVEEFERREETPPTQTPEPKVLDPISARILARRSRAVPPG